MNVDNNFQTTAPHNSHPQVNDAQNVPSRHGKSYHSLLLQQATQGLDQAGRDEFLGQVIDSDILRPAILLFANTTSCSDRLQITHRLAEFAEEHHIAVAEISRCLCKEVEYLKGPTLNQIRKILTLMPQPESILNLFTAVNISGENKHTYSQLNEIHETIQTIPGEEKDSVALYARNFLSNNLSLQHVELALSTVKSIPVNDRASVVEHCIRLVPSVDDIFREMLIDTIKKIPRNHRDSIVEQTLRLVTDDTNCYSRWLILRAVQDIGPDERTSVVDHTLLLLTNQCDTDNRISLLHELASIPTDARSSVVDHTKLLITDRWNSTDRFTLLHEVASIPTDEQTSVVDHTKLLITDQVTPTNCIHLLRNVANILREERTSVVEAILPIINRTNGKLSDHVLKVIKEIPKAKRLLTVFHALQFPVENMFSYQLAALLEQINDLPESDLTSTIEHTLRFGNAQNHYDSVMKIIQITPEEQRASLVEQSIRLIKNQMLDIDRLSMLGFVFGIGADSREFVVTNVNEMRTDQMTHEDYKSLRIALESIPQNERESVINRVLPQMTKLKNFDERLKILQDTQRLTLAAS